jgi:hypothetical protein
VKDCGEMLLNMQQCRDRLQAIHVRHHPGGWCLQVNSLPYRMTSQVDQANFSESYRFGNVKWAEIPNDPGVYVIWDDDEVLYVGMAGRNGQGGLRNRLRDHASGQIVNMFAQYLFLARVQFLAAERIVHPRDAKQACQDYIASRCSFRYRIAGSPADARLLENELKKSLRPALNP